MSIRAYARRLGISHTAVQKAIKSGRITLKDDGKIDCIKADIDWLFYASTYYSRLPAYAKVIMERNIERSHAQVCAELRAFR